MRFKTDENIPRKLTELFQNAGHDAVSALDQQLGGRPDESIAAICRREARALVTFDLDFADIRTYPPNDYPGLILLRLDRHLARRHFPLSR